MNRTRTGLPISLRQILAGITLLGFALPGLAPRANAGNARTTLSVFAAASLSDAFNELGRKFETAHPDVKVEFNFAGSQQLATQIEHGAGADLFASADERWMTYLKKRDQIQGEGTQFVQNRLVVIVPRSNPARIDKLQDLAKSGVKLVLGAETVPVGVYSREVIRRLARARGFAPDFGRRVLNNLASEEDNVKQVVAKVQLGEADAGFVYRSDVTAPVARQVKVFDISDSCSVLANYPVAVLKDAPHPDLAGEFLKLLLSPEGQAVLAKNGFLPVAPDH
jgi:molybdate transport system substrate-binding protein